MKKILVFIIAFTSFKSAVSQIGLGITTPHPNAYFQINSTNKGVLLPRMTALQRIAIAPTATANGLLVFDTDSSAYMYWTGSIWKKVGGEDGNWVKNGNNIYNSNTGNVGIGTSAPLARLHVVDSAVLYSGTHLLNYSSPAPPPITGEGNRMMWYAPKAAFVAGNFDINCNNCWNKDSIGFHSFGAGYNPKAIGLSSVSLGAGNIARESGSVAMGINSTAIGFASVAIGHISRADKYASVAIGDQAVASGAGAISLGNITESAGDASFTTGLRTKALGLYSFAAGNLSEARADYAVALGRSFANSPYSFAYGNQSAATGTGSFAGGVNAISFGENSFAFGKVVTAYANNAFCFGDNVGTKFDGSFVTGSYNELQVGLPDRIFEVANGTSSLRQNAFTILKTGAVGIGTVDPQYRLDVAGNIHAQTDVQVDGRTETDLLGANNGTIINLNVPNRITALKTSVNDSLDTRYFKLYDGFGNAGYLLTSDADGNGSWQPSAAGNWTASGTNLYNNNAGNIGLGVSDPAFRLDVGNRMRIRSGGDNLSTAGIWLNNIANDASPAFVGMESDDAVGFYSSTTGWDFVMKIGTGNVGIGTSNPKEKLQVNGNILATGTITPSDMRYKNSITTIQNPLLKLAAIHGVTYFMNRAAHPEWQFDSTLQYGLIAQEVEKVFPEMVKEISADGYKGLDYEKLVPVLLEGIKELDKENKQVKERLKILEEKMDALITNKPAK